jgi:hypothetical protein
MKALGKSGQIETRDLVIPYYMAALKVTHLSTVFIELQFNAYPFVRCWGIEKILK